MNVLTAPRVVTDTEVKRIALNLIDASPDFVYQRPFNENHCQYVHDLGTPDATGGCLIGQILLGLGLPKEVFGESITINGATTVVMNGCSCAEPVFKTKIHERLAFSERAWNAMRDAQRTQDQAFRWREVRKYFEAL